MTETLCDKVNEVTLPPWILCLCHSAFYGELEALIGCGTLSQGQLSCASL